MLSKKLFAILLGDNTDTKGWGKLRVKSISFPAKEDGDIYREIKFPGEDGLVLYFVKRIEKLEKDLEELKSKQPSKE